MDGLNETGCRSALASLAEVIALAKTRKNAASVAIEAATNDHDAWSKALGFFEEFRAQVHERLRRIEDGKNGA